MHEPTELKEHPLFPLGVCKVRCLRTAVILAMCLTATSAAAQIVPCPGATTAHGYKVLLDDFFINAPASGGGASLFMERLRASIEFSLQSLYADAGFQISLV